MCVFCFVFVFSYALVIFISFCVCSTRMVLCLLRYLFSTSLVLVHYIMFRMGDMKKMRRPNGEV